MNAIKTKLLQSAIGNVQSDARAEIIHAKVAVGMMAEIVAETKCKVCREERRMKKAVEEALRAKKLEQKRKEIEEKLVELEKAVKEGRKILRREISRDSEAHIFSELRDLTEKYVQEEHNVYLNVKKIELVVNLKLERSFWLARKNMVGVVGRAE